MEGKLNYIIGDATNPQVSGNVIITHICNDVGKWGNGFVLAVQEKWPYVKRSYMKWSKAGYDDSGEKFVLGNVQFVYADTNIEIANIIGQRDIKPQHKMPPIRYQCVDLALRKVAQQALKTHASVHMPRMGTGLAGGKWDIIEKIIKLTLISKGINVYVYDLADSDPTIGRI